eukprot:741822-Pyramimonas_sp.AAC.1
MLGTADDPGVLYLACRSILEKCAADTTRRYLLRIESMEIYNEEVYKGIRILLGGDWLSPWVYSLSTCVIGSHPGCGTYSCPTSTSSKWYRRDPHLIKRRLALTLGIFSLDVRDWLAPRVVSRRKRTLDLRQVRDLLAPDLHKLKVVDHAVTGTTCVSDQGCKSHQTEHFLSDMAEASKYISTALSSRHVAATAMNATSSRSHAL